MKIFGRCTFCLFLEMDQSVPTMSFRWTNHCVTGRASPAGSQLLLSGPYHARVMEVLDRLETVPWNGCEHLTNSGSLEEPQRYTICNIPFGWTNHLQHSGVASSSRVKPSFRALSGSLKLMVNLRYGRLNLIRRHTLKVAPSPSTSLKFV